MYQFKFYKIVKKSILNSKQFLIEKTIFNRKKLLKISGQEFQTSQQESFLSLTESYS